MLCIVVGAAYAQAQQHQQDEVHLKNGSIIRGIIVEQVPNVSIKVNTADGSVFVYAMDEVARIAKVAAKSPKRMRTGDSPLSAGYRGIVETGFALGVGDFAADRITLNSVHGYQFNPHFFAGLGTGARYYYDSSSFVVPVFADFRVNLLDRKTSPYLAVGIGYSFDANSNFEGFGLLVNPSVGISFAVSKKSVMHVGAGYELQRAKAYYYDYYSGHSWSSNESMSAISINIGISF